MRKSLYVTRTRRQEFGTKKVAQETWGKETRARYREEDALQRLDIWGDNHLEPEPNDSFPCTRSYSAICLIISS